MSIQSIQAKILDNNESILTLTSAIESVSIQGVDWRAGVINQVEAQNKILVEQLEEMGVIVC